MNHEITTAGIDIGSCSAQAVIMRGDSILSYSNIKTGSNSRDIAQQAFTIALEQAGITPNDIRFVIGTGYGRYQIPFADRYLTEITCHARGANYFFPNVRTVLDMGGQDCKAIRCDENGKVKAFVMNDKCAAGTGRSMEVISRLLDIPLENIGPLSLDVRGTPPVINSLCVVFAKSKALQMIRSGVPVSQVLAAYCQTLVDRVLSLINRVGFMEELAITGGIAKNSGVVKRIEEKLKTKADICFEPQIVGAVGAALEAQKIKQRPGNA